MQCVCQKNQVQAGVDTLRVTQEIGLVKKPFISTSYAAQITTTIILKIQLLPHPYTHQQPIQRS